MNHEQSMPAYMMEEMLESFLWRMKPDLQEGDEEKRPGWWIRDLAIALTVGCVIGFFIYQVGGTGTPETTAAIPALAPPAPAPQEQAALPVPQAPHQQPKTAEQTPQAADETDAFQEPAPEEGPEAVARAAIPEDTRQRKVKPYRQRQFVRLVRKGWRLYAKTGYHAASIAFGRAVHMAPRQTEGYYGLALCMFEQGREDMAMWVIQRGLEKVGPKADLWVLAGSIHQWKGRETAARSAYQKYLKHNPKGQYAGELRRILAYAKLPRLEPYQDQP